MRKIKFRVREKGFFDYPTVVSLNVNQILEQFTGLQDDRFTDIYEGDIVKFEYIEPLATVRWDDSYCRFSFFFDEMSVKRSYDNMRYKFDGGGCMVVGNIHEGKQ
jgi:uncharacterized phage protein (TIGR01671 family)